MAEQVALRQANEYQAEQLVNQAGTIGSLTAENAALKASQTRPTWRQAPWWLLGGGLGSPERGHDRAGAGAEVTVVVEGHLTLTPAYFVEMIVWELFCIAVWWQIWPPSRCGGADVAVLTVCRL